MLWINFLHLYQPVNKDAHVIKEATEKSYKRIIRALEKNRQVKFTLNISGCLFLRWEELGYFDLIKRIKKLLETGQIELTGTACYHPLLPLIPEKEIKRQIKENEQILSRHFGKYYKPKGFFLPEMAYHPNVARIIKRLGYVWLILDEAHVPLSQAEPGQKIFVDASSGLKALVRDRAFSNSYVPETLLPLAGGGQTIVTATDGELYGLRHNDPETYFEKLLKHKRLETETISGYLKNHPGPKESMIRPASWESSEEELRAGKPFILWDDKAKPIQQRIWELARLAYDTAERNAADGNYAWARWHLVRGLSSCTFWWASGKDFKAVFGPHAWNPDEIERGTDELIRSIRALENEKTRATKLKAEKLYVAIKKMVWQEHWTYYWKRRA